MLSCKEVATLASDYMDKNTQSTLTWKIRLHLLMCANCRRFLRHLKITQSVSSEVAKQSVGVDAETIWKNIKKHRDNDQ